MHKKGEETNLAVLAGDGRERVLDVPACERNELACPFLAGLAYDTPSANMNGWRESCYAPAGGKNVLNSFGRQVTGRL
jgi:hypothetical protein